MDSALGTALYILRGLDEGQNKYEIIQRLDNNEQLVTVWLEKDIPGNPLAQNVVNYGYSDMRRPLVPNKQYLRSIA